MGDSGQKYSDGFASSFFHDMPPWARAIVFGLTAIPVAVAVSGMILNVNVGSYLDTYMEIQLERQRTETEQVADKIITAIGSRISIVEKRIEQIVIEAAQADMELAKRLQIVESDIRDVKSWACGPVFQDGNVKNDPEFCQ